jgi:uncharacterized protein YdaU (DUF1376 family)
MNFWPRYVGDIQRKTGHLSCAEMGVFDRLLDHVYATEQQLPGDVDACCRIARAMDKAERKAVESVLRQFFLLEGGFYVNARAAEEMVKAAPKLAAARANGLKGGRPKQTEQKPSGLPDGLPTGTHEEPTRETPQNQSIPSEYKYPPNPRKRGQVSEFPPGFDAFWTAYPRKQAKGAAIKAYARLRADDTLQAAMLAAIAKQAASSDWARDGGKWIPYPATWLNDRRWEDQLPGVDADPYGLRTAL